MDVVGVKFITLLFTYTTAHVKGYDTLYHLKKLFVQRGRSKNRRFKM